MFFIGTGSDVSDAPGKYLFGSFFSSIVFEPGRKATSLTIPEETFLEHGITPGTTVYIVAYAVNYLSTQYYDPMTNEFVFSSKLAPSSVASVVVP